MKIKDLRAKKTDELSKNLLEFKKELFNLRFQKVSGELTKTHRIRYIRRSVAKIETLLNEKIEEKNNA
ncbi:MAG: 50S ribosomal protein L29 [Alphaproteobacteria bacterium]|nr:50S ribosomal protein L29 [Alphaproteobacteria bacterium]